MFIISCFCAPDPQTTNGDSVSARDPLPWEPEW